MSRRIPVVLAALGVLTCALSSRVQTGVTAQAARREIAVTFDDLPVISVTQLDADARRALTRRLLGAVTSNAVPAVGFVNEYGLYGYDRAPKQRDPDPDGVSLLAMWIDAGLELGNHTFAHSDLHAMTLSGFEEDVVRGEAVTLRLLHEKGRRLRFFRHPYLHAGRDPDTKAGLERFLADRGYRVAPVTVDAEDYLFAAAYSRAAERGERETMDRIAADYVRYTERVLDYSERLSRVLFGREIRQILLLHANALNADRFGSLARMLQMRGYAFVPLEDALADEAYRSEDAYTGEESINWLDRWAITRGLKDASNVLDDFPDVPDYVVKASGG